MPRVFSNGHGYYVIALLTRTEPEAQFVEDELDAVRQQLTELARTKTTRVWIESRQRELQETGALQIYPLYPQN